MNSVHLLNCRSNRVNRQNLYVGIQASRLLLCSPT